MSHKAPVYPTLFACYRSTEKYLQSIARLAGSMGQARVTLGPMDAFILHQMAGFHPLPPVVIDLAADASCGASAAFWATRENVRRVCVPRLTTGQGSEWRGLFAEAAALEDADAARITLYDIALDRAGGWEALRTAICPSRPVFISVAVWEDAATTRATLDAVVTNYPNAAVFVIGLGLVGASVSLEASLAFCRASSRLRMMAFREVSPFLAASQLGMIYDSGHSDVEESVGRIRKMYEGNFDFLSLAKMVTLNAVASEGRGGPVAQREPQLPPREQEYDTMRQKMRDTLCSMLPFTATVAVVSKGDDDMLNLRGRRSWHFPCSADGIYAGHYPKDSSEAIQEVELLRSRGAEFLVFPATAFWWLEYYSDLKQYLESNHTLAVRREECIVYALSGDRARKQGEQPGNYGDLIANIRDVARTVLPHGATVLVASKGDPELLAFAGCGATGWHFPRAADGEFAGHYPANDADAIAQLEALRAKGAQYLLLPRTAYWWLDHYADFRRHIEQHYSRVACDEQHCLIFDITPRPNSTAPARVKRWVPTWLRR